MLADEIDDALRELVAARIELDAKEAELVVRARSDGATWTDLGRSLGLSKQAVRKRHLAIDPIFARRSTRPPTIDEYHAEIAAAMRAGVV
jgi:hypothetical protein